jgi:transcriptional regulator with XRE-family HTH domain
MTSVTPVRIRLREIRESKQLSQAALAELSGIRKATISDIENAKTNGVDFDTLERLANALGVDAALLIEHTRKPR